MKKIITIDLQPIKDAINALKIVVFGKAVIAAQKKLRKARKTRNNAVKKAWKVLTK
tara:strand:- start:966 stop:1133 length:168 start_codon:yes stop_codon:yes gene_type:complete